MQYFIRQHRTARTMQLIKTILLACVAMEINAQQVSFDAEITVHGEEIRSYAPVDVTGSFPYFEVQGTAVKNKSATSTYSLCMSDQQIADGCTLDTSRGSSRSRRGYSIQVTTMNSPGEDASEKYSYDDASKCLNSEVTVTAKR